MKSITVKNTNNQSLIIISFAVMFISRVLVISGNYTIPVDATLIEIIYLGIIVTIGVFKVGEIKISKK